MALIDSYSETNQNDVFAIDDTRFGAGQSFTGNGYNITSVKFYLRKVLSPTGNAVAKIYAHSGTYGTSSVPTGTALGTSGTLDVSTLTTSFVLYELTFSTPVATVNGTKYVVTIEYMDGTSTNFIRAGTDSTTPTHGGNSCRLVGASWTAYADDVCFYLYGTPPAWSITSSISVTGSLTAGVLNKRLITTTGSTSSSISGASSLKRNITCTINGISDFSTDSLNQRFITAISNTTSSFLAEAGFKLMISTTNSTISNFDANSILQRIITANPNALGAFTGASINQRNITSTNSTVSLFLSDSILQRIISTIVNTIGEFTADIALKLPTTTTSDTVSNIIDSSLSLKRGITTANDIVSLFIATAAYTWFESWILYSEITTEELLESLCTITESLLSEVDDVNI